MNITHKKKAISTETFVVTLIFIVAFIVFSIVMSNESFFPNGKFEILKIFGAFLNGMGNFLDTFIKTAYSLLINTALWVMAVVVLTSAAGSILSEFGVFALLNKLLAPVTKVMYKLPGISALGIILAFLSDNPAGILSSKEKEFRKQFKPYQIPVLCNLATSFGMGMVVFLAMFTMSGKVNEHVTYSTTSYQLAAFIGIIGAIIGSVVSVRLLNKASMKHYGIKKDSNPIKEVETEDTDREVREGSSINRFLESALDGGKAGVEIGLQIIPGILIISTLVMMLTYGMPEGGYTGGAEEGIRLIPTLFQPLSPILKILFGLSSAEAVTFPLTSLGSAAAAIGLVPKMLNAGQIGLKEIAVFTAMGTTWGGYLSTHISMMDSLGARKLAGKAIITHTIGGIVSGISANVLYDLIVYHEVRSLFSAFIFGLIVAYIVVTIHTIILVCKTKNENINTMKKIRLILLATLLPIIGSVIILLTNKDTTFEEENLISI